MADSRDRLGKTQNNLLEYLVVSESNSTNQKVLTSTTHTLKLEQYRDVHGPCTRITCRLVKHSIFL